MGKIYLSRSIITQVSYDVLEGLNKKCELVRKDDKRWMLSATYYSNKNASLCNGTNVQDYRNVYWYIPTIFKKIQWCHTKRYMEVVSEYFDSIFYSFISFNKQRTLFRVLNILRMSSKER